MKNAVDLICSVAELARMFEAHEGLRGFLARVVDVLAEHMRSPVCSIYLHDEQRNTLILSATRGLNPEFVDSLEMTPEQGLTGLAFRTGELVNEPDAPSNPAFRHISGIREEPYRAFLAVPIVQGLRPVGVLVAQHEQVGYFDANDAKALQAISAQLASTVEYTRLLLRIHPEHARPGEAIPTHPDGLVSGTAGSGAIVLGTTRVHGEINSRLAAGSHPALKHRTLTRADFERALTAAEKQIDRLEAIVEQRMVDAAAATIFGAHRLMLLDDDFAGEMRRRIEHGTPVAEAVVAVVNRFVELFSAARMQAIREKAQDVLDLGHRLLANLGGEGEEPDQSELQGRIVIARELLPSDVVRLAARGVGGLVLLSGGDVSHVAILARSMEIPFILAEDLGFLNLPDGTEAILDPPRTNIYVNPTQATRDHFRRQIEAALHAGELDERPGAAAQTRDGVRVHLLANINLCAELDLARQFRAEGIGLYRSEFPFMVRRAFPSEEEQFRIYRRVAENGPPGPVTFRTLDIGGDKLLAYSPVGPEHNPFLGLRALRFSLRYGEVLRTQLRALLRAGSTGSVRVLFPMVASLDDFLEARHSLELCRRQLQDETGQEVCCPEVGAMIEVPAALEILDALCAHADFLSVGTNDLVQYLLAVDRTNAAVRSAFTPYHPAVLRALDRIVRTAQNHGTPVSICGEVTTDPVMLPLLLGLGFRDLSMDAHRIPEVRRRLSQLDLTECTRTADLALRMSKVSDIHELLSPEGRRSEQNPGEPVAL